MTAVKPSDALADQVWLVKVDGVPHLGVRRHPSATLSWSVASLTLGRITCCADNDVLLVRRLLPAPDPAPVATRPDEVPLGQPWTVCVAGSGVECLATRCDPSCVKSSWQVNLEAVYYRRRWVSDAEVTLVAPWVRQDQAPTVEGRRKRELRAERDALLARCRELEDQTTRLTEERDEARGERDHAITEAHQLRDELDTCQLLPADLPSPDAGKPEHLRWAVALIEATQIDPGVDMAAAMGRRADRIEAEQRVEAAEVRAVAAVLDRAYDGTRKDITPRSLAAEFVAAARRAREEADR